METKFLSNKERIKSMYIKDLEDTIAQIAAVFNLTPTDIKTHGAEIVIKAVKDLKHRMDSLEK
jgi:hypothetical protein